MSKLFRKVNALTHIVAYKLKLTKRPIALRWNITSGCPKRCHYCNNDKIARPEPSTQEIDQLIHKVKSSRPSRISISGGEPLTSPHFGRIVDSLTEAGISVIMNTSAINIERQKSHVAKLDLVQFSLDGKQENCDLARGPGTFQKVMEGMQVCQSLGVKFTFSTTLSRENTSLDTVDYMLAMAKKHKTVVAFQPVKRVYGLEEDYDHSAPNPAAMREVVAYLVKLKKEGNKNIRNSMVGLKHISQWPIFPKMECTGGKMFAVIQPDGYLVACDRIDTPLSEDINLKSEDIVPSLATIPTPNCEGCGFCGATELNYLNNLNFSVLSDLRKL